MRSVPTAVMTSELRSILQDGRRIYGAPFEAFRSLHRPEARTASAISAFEDSYLGTYPSMSDLVIEALLVDIREASLAGLRADPGAFWNDCYLANALQVIYEIVEFGGRFTHLGGEKHNEAAYRGPLSP